MDDDLATLDRDALIAEVKRLRDGIREHRDSSGHELCWHHPRLWALLPERSDPLPSVPEWPQFLRGCIRYRESLDRELPDAPRTRHEFVRDSSRALKPTIARVWRGRTPRDRADEYERYNYDAGIAPLIEKAMGVQTLREDRDLDSEFVTISYWESVEAMARYAGADPRRIHHLERDAEFLIELPEGVQVLDIAAVHGRTG